MSSVRIQKIGNSSRFRYGGPTKFESSFSKLQNWDFRHFLPIFKKYPYFQKILKGQALKIRTFSGFYPFIFVFLQNQLDILTNTRCVTYSDTNIWIIPILIHTVTNTEISYGYKKSGIFLIWLSILFFRPLKAYDSRCQDGQRYTKFKKMPEL